MVKKFTVEVAVGDKIEIGRFRNVHATIEDIEFDKWGHPCLNLGRHKKMLFNCRLLKLIPKDVKRNNPLTPIDEKDLNK